MVTFADLTSPTKQELWAVLALRHAAGIGPRRAKRLVESFGSAFAAVDAGLASAEAWTARDLMSTRIAKSFATESWRAAATEEWKAIQKTGCAFLAWSDPQYPDVLRSLVDAPLLLYCKGNLALLNGPAVGVVGARNCTREGVAVSAFFSRGLTKAGVAVISGMAKGIDRAAHLAGLEGAGRSIAVLGTGIDVVYPPCNADLYELLGREGLIVSEFAPGSTPNPKHFPIRNRLISGLSQGVLVVEAAGRSGSLITARLALEQNRDVFAVPGHTMATVSAGCRELIRRGAKAVFSADDILQDLAPLLTLEARAALQKRQETLAGEHPAPARRQGNNPHEADLASAEAVLPSNELPWMAEAQPRRRAKANTSAPQPGRKRAVRSEQGQPSCITPAKAVPQQPMGLSAEESRILASLSTEEQHIDVLTRALGMDVAKLSGLLTVLEIRGLVLRKPGMLYSLPKA